MPKNHTLGILDADTDEVPGTVLLLSGGTSQEPLGLDIIQRKRTANGIILEPQPDDHPDDPLNWASWRRDLALIALGWHCLIGGGQTPVLAAGFPEVAETYDVSIPSVALTTGLYMLGLGIGCILTSPTAILFGKRPVYLGGVVLFCVSSVWCALSPSYPSLVIARIVMGIGVSPCESLPSATIAEIFFLHERAYRVGIYTLLLLGGKNLVPLVSAVVINAMGWRWVFWIVAIIVGVNLGLLFLFVPETFWDRTPRPKPGGKGFLRRVSSSIFSYSSKSGEKRSHSRSRSKHSAERGPVPTTPADGPEITRTASAEGRQTDTRTKFAESTDGKPTPNEEEAPSARQIYQMDQEKTSRASLDQYVRAAATEPIGSEKDEIPAVDPELNPVPAKPWKASLKIWNGRIREGSWSKVAVRPLILFAYPAVLWSTVVYSFSIGWLIVLSESVAHIYQENPYSFTPLATGLIYLSPFVGGILGTAVAGKVSDIVVRMMCRRNAGIYEPEFRLIMGIPVAITTAIGLMGFGWSSQAHDGWIVPTVFFGIISFGCSLGSTTAITFCVDSYRQYAGEALVTLNFSKNVLHGFVFSLFFNHWLDHDGPKMTFVALGIIQVGALLFTIPLYMYGKRLRIWTVRKGMMEKWT